jgi:hypothetical protein
MPEPEVFHPEEQPKGKDNPGHGGSDIDKLREEATEAGFGPEGSQPHAEMPAHPDGTFGEVSAPAGSSWDDTHAQIEAGAEEALKAHRQEDRKRIEAEASEELGGQLHDYISGGEHQDDGVETVGEVAVGGTTEEPEVFKGEAGADSTNDSAEMPKSLEQLHRELIEAARATEAEVDVSGFTGEQREFDSFESLVRGGDQEAIDRALRFIEDQDNKFFGRDDDRTGSRKQLAYRDLAIAAYEAGLTQEGDELASKVYIKSMIGPLLFAKAEASEDGVAELIDQFGRAEIDQYKHKFEKLASLLIAQGRLEAAKNVAGVLHDERKFRVLLDLVKAGEKDMIDSARQSALELRRDLGGGQKTGEGPSAEEKRIRSLLELYDAGDEQAISSAFEVAQSEVRPERRLSLLGWLGSEVKKRENQQQSTGIQQEENERGRSEEHVTSGDKLDLGESSESEY